MKYSLSLTYLVTIYLLVSCNPSEKAQEIKVTKVEEYNNVTQDIIPTSTDQFTSIITRSTPGSTNTSSPSIVHTLTPFPLEEGWQDYSMSGFRLALPESWEVIDVNPSNVDEIWKKLEEVDADWANTIKVLFSSQYVQEAIKLWAKDESTAIDGQGNLVVVSQKLPVFFSTENLCEQLKSAYELLGGRIIDSTCGMQINGMEAHRFTLRVKVGAHSIKQRLYLFTLGRQIWAINAYVSGKGWSLYDPVFNQIANTLRINELDNNE